MNYLNKKSVEDINVFEKKVLLRCDFNVPLDKNGNISNTKRIDDSLQTICYLIKNNAKTIIISHLGRPNGSKKAELSLKPIADYLTKILNVNVKFISDDMKNIFPEDFDSLKNGEIALLENIRFYKEEQLNDLDFAKKLASFADVFVNDAFGTAHRAHASTEGVAKLLPSVCGFLIKNEVNILCKILNNPERPFLAILGGSKVSDKIGVINNLIDKVDTLIIAGGMSYTFLNALGYSIGNSIFEADKISLATDIITKAKDLNVKLILPVDNVVGKEFSANTDSLIVDSDSIPEGYIGLDIGPKSERLFSDIIKNSRTILWNGPVGVFEWEKFRHGTLKIAQAIANSRAVSVVGGGDSSAAISLLELDKGISHLSTGGGATLAFLEGKSLPAIDALDDK